MSRFWPWTAVVGAAVGAVTGLLLDRRRTQANPGGQLGAPQGVAYGPPEVMARSLEEADRMTQAVDELTRRFLGKSGVVSIGDAITAEGPTIFVWVRGALETARRMIPGEFMGIPVILRSSQGIIAIYGTRPADPGEPYGNGAVPQNARWYGQIDLPPGWEGAASLEVIQTPCRGNALGAEPAKVSVDLSPSGLRVIVKGFSARCEQKLAVFARRDAERHLDLLVQPEDMEPSGVARCSCLYDLTARVTRSGVGRIEDATRVLRVFERDDRYGSQGREPEVRLVAILGKWFDAYVTRTGT